MKAGSDAGAFLFKLADCRIEIWHGWELYLKTVDQGYLPEEYKKSNHLRSAL